MHRALIAIALALGLGLAACSSSTQAVEHAVTVSHAVPYAPGLLADLYVPTGDPAGPTIVWVHGGGFSAGDRTDLAALATALARRGYPGVAIDYRLSPDDGWFPATTLTEPSLAAAAAKAVADTSAAVAWLDSADAARAGLPPGRGAIVAGYSAGAITAVMLAQQHPAQVRGAVAISGAALDPAQLGAGLPPLLLVHGAKDDVIPVGLAAATCQAAEQHGDRCTLRTVAGVGHDLPFSRSQLVVDQVSAFLGRVQGETPSTAVP